MKDKGIQGNQAAEGDALQGRPHQKQGPHHHHHGHGSNHHHHEHDAHHHDEPMSQPEAVRSLLLLGQVALNARDHESAVEAYASVLKLEPNVTAFYNLGSLTARGLGVRRDYAEAARLFHQAELLGNSQAGKLCQKCLFDYACEDIESKKPADLYAELAVFVSRVYPEATDHKQEVNRGLSAVADTLLSKGEYASAAKAFRAAAEFGGDGYAQYSLAVLYHAGAGVQESDLVALYWLDCAVDNGAADVARADRDGMLAAYKEALPAEEFRAMLAELSAWCEVGTPDIPVDVAQAQRWREVL